MSFKDNSSAMCEARKASPDWHGISVLSCLISFGAWMAEGERDSAPIHNRLAYVGITRAAETLHVVADQEVG